MSLPILTKKTGATSQIDLYCNNMNASTVTLNGFDIGHFYAPPIQFFQLTSGFFTGTRSVDARIVGFEELFNIITGDFTVTGNGGSGAFTGSVPNALEQYDMSGVLIFTASGSPDVKQLAFVSKPENVATLTIVPQNAGQFTNAAFGTQTLSFRAGHLFCALRNY